MTVALADGPLSEHRCPACTAPRLDSVSPCRECGATAPDTILADLPCRRCGYSLKGLSPDALCPECGSPVRLSMMGDFLGASDPAHLSRLVRGAMMVEIALYLSVLMLCVGSPLTIALTPSTGSATGIIVGLGNLVLGLMGLAGWWLLSTRDPGRSAESRGEASRATLRVCVVISTVAALLGSGGVAATPIIARTGAGPMVVYSGVALGFLTWVVQYFASVEYVRVLAARIPSPGLAETARTTMLLPVWTFGLGIPLLAGSALLAAAAPPAGLIAIVVVAGMGIACLVWFIWYCSMISGLRDRLETVRATMPQVVPD